MKDAFDSVRVATGYGVTVANVNEALPLGLQLVKDVGVPFVSRGIPTLEVPGPVSTIYHRPWERVLFDPVRDANPFFHLMESLWILGGSNEVELPSHFLGNITGFSDNGKTFHGAYGYRLRSQGFGDQLTITAQMLRERPDTRQAVMAIWNPALDMDTRSKDIPCNDMIMFGIREGKLNMTVCNRSNDVIWGAYGANAVQFSMIHEWMASAAGVTMGYYVQQSNSYHVYPSNPFWQAFLDGEHAPGHVHNPYISHHYPLTVPLVGPHDTPEAFLEDCEGLCEQAHKGTIGRTSGNSVRWRTQYFRQVVEPMLQAYNLYKKGLATTALFRLQDVIATDWRMACMQWVQRRIDKAVVKADAAGAVALAKVQHAGDNLK